MPDSTISSIRYGVYAGECIGYCRESMTITPDRIVYRKQSNLPSGEQPDKVLDEKTAPELWHKLLDAIDLKIVTTLPAKLGQPDAADQGGEYVDVMVNELSNRIEFERMRNVAGLDRLLAVLRPLQAEFSERMGN